MIILVSSHLSEVISTRLLSLPLEADVSKYAAWIRCRNESFELTHYVYRYLSSNIFLAASLPVSATPYAGKFRCGYLQLDASRLCEDYVYDSNKWISSIGCRYICLSLLCFPEVQSLYTRYNPTLYPGRLTDIPPSFAPL